MKMYCLILGLICIHSVCAIGENSIISTTNVSLDKSIERVTFQQLNCGQPAISPLSKSKDARIIGGSEATPGSWPWQVRLILDFGIGGTGLCGGSIINENWIVTAAHCVLNEPFTIQRVEVQAGLHNVGDTTGIHIVYAVTVKYHSNYDSILLSNDIAVLELQSPLSFTSTVSPICLSEDNSVIVTSTSTCFATGWGLIAPEGRAANVLQEVQLNVIYNTICGLQHSNIEDTHLCAGSSGRSACNGDSGGPLACYINERWYLMGITSFGQPLCNTVNDTATVFTRTSEYVEWIDQAISDTTTVSTTSVSTTSSTNPPTTSSTEKLAGIKCPVILGYLFVAVVLFALP